MATTDSTHSKLPHTPTCWICGKPVVLETCKTDEHGNSVHEECQFLRVALAKPPKSVKPTPSRWFRRLD
jgi:hypothetical protein